VKFSREGLCGKGIYFADNAAYSQSYAYKQSDGIYKLIFSYVIVGRYKQFERPKNFNSKKIKSSYLNNIVAMMNMNPVLPYF